MSTEISEEQALNNDVELQELIAKFLRDDPFFKDVEIVTELTGDLNNRINRALAHLKSGVAVIVMTPVEKVTKPNVPGPFYDDVEVVIQCVENSIINRSKTGANKPPKKMARRVHQLLHHTKLAPFKRPLVAVGIETSPDLPAGLIGRDAVMKTSCY